MLRDQKIPSIEPNHDEAIGRGESAHFPDKATNTMGDRGDSDETYQDRVHRWSLACFGEQVAADTDLRNYRFYEEATELVQAAQCSREFAHKIVDYVFDRPIGDPALETGGVLVTLAALCNAHRIDMMEEAERELARIWTIMDKIRAKQATKISGSPLPGDADSRTIGLKLGTAIVNEYIGRAVFVGEGEFAVANSLRRQFVCRDIAQEMLLDAQFQADETDGVDSGTRAAYRRLAVQITKALKSARTPVATERLAIASVELATARAELDRLKLLIDTPQTADWFDGVRYEAAHQIKRWGVEHDVGKTGADWFWLIGYLAGKALHATTVGDAEKAKHHTISTGAALLNWFRAIAGESQEMRPGVALQSD